MGLFNIFGDSSIIFGFMFILNKNLSDIKEKITIILEVHHPKKNVHHRPAVHGGQHPIPYFKPCGNEMEKM
ncbi:MAG: hypothetical protein C6W56_10705 [Caldibacillus debilis]|nr:hypothetical protein [Bacillaceae bacterium]REJ27332.1 MAG: hypothetical protein C6W56_10705 [Caldibacillus debilis]